MYYDTGVVNNFLPGHFSWNKNQYRTTFFPDIEDRICQTKQTEKKKNI